MCNLGLRLLAASYFRLLRRIAGRVNRLSYDVGRACLFWAFPLLSLPVVHKRHEWLALSLTICNVVSNEHIHSGDVWNSGCAWLPCLASHAHLGLGAVDGSTKAENRPVHPIFNWFHSCHGFGPACHHVRRICSLSHSVLRPVAPPDISMWIAALLCRIHLRRSWCVAMEFSAVARSCMWACNACILDNRSGKVND